MFSRNIGFMNGSWTSVADSATQYFKEIANDITNQDPLFVDEGKLNLTLRRTRPRSRFRGSSRYHLGISGSRRNVRAP